MRIPRREAFLALVATMLPWFGRRASAQERLQAPTATKVVPSPEIVDLQRRVAALEAQLATQVGFVKDSYGNLKLKGAASVSIETTGSFAVKASGSVDVFGSGPTAIRGSTIALN